MPQEELEVDNDHAFQAYIPLPRYPTSTVPTFPRHRATLILGPLCVKNLKLQTVQNPATAFFFPYVGCFDL